MEPRLPDQAEPNTLDLINLYQVPVREIAPMPGNKYEIAVGVYATLKIPTEGTCKAFDENEKPISDLAKSNDAWLEYYALKKEDKTGERPEGKPPTMEDFQRLQREISMKQVRTVLDFGAQGVGELEKDGLIIEPMAVVVRNHFTYLRSPTGQRPGASSGEAVQPSNGASD